MHSIMASCSNKGVSRFKQRSQHGLEPPGTEHSELGAEATGISLIYQQPFHLSKDISHHIKLVLLM